MNWEIGIDMYTLICIKWITNKNLLYKKINKIKFKKKKKKESGKKFDPGVHNPGNKETPKPKSNSDKRHQKTQITNENLKQ